MSETRRWRVCSWHEGEPITIIFEDGERLVCDPPLHADSEDWDVEMWADSTDDLNAAGWKVNPATELFEAPEGWVGDAPTRWRSARELPEWVRALTEKAGQ